MSIATLHFAVSHPSRKTVVPEEAVDEQKTTFLYIQSVCVKYEKFSNFCMCVCVCVCLFVCACVFGIVLYCGRVPAANSLGCTAAEGLLYKPWSLVVPNCIARCLHQRP